MGAARLAGQDFARHGASGPARAGNGDHLRVRAGNGDHLRARAGNGDHLRARAGNGDHLRVRAGNGDHLRARAGNGDHLRARAGSGDHLRVRAGNGDHLRARAGNGDHLRARAAPRERRYQCRDRMLHNCGIRNEEPSPAFHGDSMIRIRLRRLPGALTGVLLGAAVLAGIPPAPSAMAGEAPASPLPERNPNPPLSTLPDSARVRFPTVTGENLEGTEMTLPRDFAGKLNLVLIAFEREQQEDVDTWTPTARGLAATQPGFASYELPVIEPKSGLVKFFINRGMRSGIPERAVREHTVTLYLDKGPFKRALGIASEAAITVLLVDDAGRTVWRTAGPATPEETRELNMIVLDELRR